MADDDLSVDQGCLDLTPVGLSYKHRRQVRRRDQARPTTVKHDDVGYLARLQ